MELFSEVRHSLTKVCIFSKQVALKKSQIFWTFSELGDGGVVEFCGMMANVEFCSGSATVPLIGIVDVEITSVGLGVEEIVVEFVSIVPFNVGPFSNVELFVTLLLLAFLLANDENNCNVNPEPGHVTATS